MAAPVASSSAAPNGIQQRILVIEDDIKRIDGEIAAVGEKIRTAEANPPAWLAALTAEQRGTHILALHQEKAALREEKNLLLKERAAALAGSAAASGGQSKGKSATASDGSSSTLIWNDV
jgi:hypothetical protein